MRKSVSKFFGVSFNKAQFQAQPLHVRLFLVIAWYLFSHSVGFVVGRSVRGYLLRRAQSLHSQALLVELQQAAAAFEASCYPCGSGCDCSL